LRSEQHEPGRVWVSLTISLYLSYLPCSQMSQLQTVKSTERRYAVAIFVRSASFDLFTRITLMPLTQVFFCKYNDPIYVKMEKLEIMIKLASDRNIDQVCQSYHCICPLSHTHHHIKRHFKLIKARFLLCTWGYYSRLSIPCCC
jgi:vesicle coat complex subunit